MTKTKLVKGAVLIVAVAGGMLTLSACGLDPQEMVAQKVADAQEHSNETWAAYQNEAVASYEEQKVEIDALISNLETALEAGDTGALTPLAGGIQPDDEEFVTVADLINASPVKSAWKGTSDLTFSTADLDAPEFNFPKYDTPSVPSDGGEEFAETFTVEEEAPPSDSYEIPPSLTYVVSGQGKDFEIAIVRDGGKWVAGAGLVFRIGQVIDPETGESVDAQFDAVAANRVTIAGQKYADLVTAEGNDGGLYTMIGNYEVKTVEGFDQTYLNVGDLSAPIDLSTYTPVTTGTEALTMYAQDLALRVMDACMALGQDYYGKTIVIGSSDGVSVTIDGTDQQCESRSITSLDGDTMEGWDVSVAEVLVVETAEATVAGIALNGAGGTAVTRVTGNGDENFIADSSPSATYQHDIEKVEIEVTFAPDGTITDARSWLRRTDESRVV